MPGKRELRMRVGCAAYSYREVLKAGGGMSLEQFIDTCGEMGLDGVELTSYYFGTTDRQYLNALKRHCFLRGMHILGSAVGSNFTQAEESKRREQVRMTKDWIDHSVVLGAPCIRVFAGPIPDGVAEEQAFNWALECIQECVAHAEPRGVVVALENHGGVTSTAEQVTKFLDRIDSPWFGINLDFGNFRADPYAEFARIAPRAVTTHAKLTSRFGEDRGEVDYARVRRIMEEAGYRGYISIEYEEKEHPSIGVPPFAKHLTQVFGS